MTKEAFLKELDEIVQDTLFMGHSVDDFNEEISQNHWSVSAEQKLVKQLTMEDLLTFFRQVQTNRKEQIVRNGGHDMIFYVWFDEQSASLHFNLLSDFYAKLPFGCSYQTIDAIEPILHDFLRFPHHDGFPIEDTENEEMIENEADIEPLRVYSILLTHVQ